MRRLQLLAFFCLLFLFSLIKPTHQILSAKIASRGIKLLTQKNIGQLTGINFNDFQQRLKTEEDWIVLFFADWCPFSKKFTSQVYLGIKNLIANLEFGVIPAAVQCPSNREICQNLNVNAYPTIYYFPSKGGKHKFPNRPKTKDNIQKFMKLAHQKIPVDKNQDQLAKQGNNQVSQFQTKADLYKAQDFEQDQQEEQEINQKQQSVFIQNSQEQLSMLKRPQKSGTQEHLPLIQSSHLKQKFLLCLLVVLSSFVFAVLLKKLIKLMKKRSIGASKNTEQNISSMQQAASSQRGNTFNPHTDPIVSSEEPINEQ